MLSFASILHTHSSVFVIRPTDRTSVAQVLFRWVQTQGSSPDTPGGYKNASSSVDIHLKIGRLGRQAINLASPRRVRAWRTAILGLSMPFLARVIWMPASRNPCQTAATNCHLNQDTPELTLLQSRYHVHFRANTLGKGMNPLSS